MPRKSLIKKQYIFAVGRRREAVARVRLYNLSSGLVDVFDNQYKKGDIIVNGKSVQEYFSYKAYAPVYQKFLQDAKVGGKYIFSIKVNGGGISGQLEAAIHGMARALDKLNHDEFHELLKANGYFTRDPRTRERRKVGNAGKARRKKSSPKR